jgi:predicted metal-dependent hydrolase
MTTSFATNEFDVEIRKSGRRRNTAALRLDSSGKFILSVPEHCSRQWMDEFLVSRKAWMQKALAEMQERKVNKLVTPGMRVNTDFHSVTILRDDALTYPRYRITRNNEDASSVFYLASDFFLPERTPQLCAHLEKYMLSQMMKVGSQYLVDRGHYWANLHGIRVKEFFVKAQKSRLGYCTPDDRIMLNARLLFAPVKIRDYVICHELAHTRHRDHSKHYWSYLERLFPGAKATDKLLRDPQVYGLRLSEAEVAATG